VAGSGMTSEWNSTRKMCCHRHHLFTNDRRKGKNDWKCFTQHTEEIKEHGQRKQMKVVSK